MRTFPSKLVGAVMESPTHVFKNILKSVLEDLHMNPNCKQQYQQIAAHLLFSRLYRVVVNNEDGMEPATKKFIIKTPREEAEIIEKFDTIAFFTNEVAFYSEILKAFSDLQKSSLGYEEFQSIPKCYKAINASDLKLIVLEDLTDKGFVETNRMQKLDISELTISMRELGRFHALSLALKIKNPEHFAMLKTKCKETSYRDNFIESNFKEAMRPISEWVMKLAKENFPPESAYVQKLGNFDSDRLVYIMRDTILPKAEDEQFSVFNHGDLWVNNLMFQYPDKENGVIHGPNKMCFIDFQQCRYGSLAVDLVGAFYQWMDQEMKIKYKHKLLTEYYRNLNDFLRQLGCDEVFPFSALEDQMTKHALFGVGLSFFALCYNLTDESEEDLDDSRDPVGNVTEECRKRVLEVIKESVDLGYV